MAVWSSMQTHYPKSSIIHHNSDYQKAFKAIVELVGLVNFSSCRPRETTVITPVCSLLLSRMTPGFTEMIFVFCIYNIFHIRCHSGANLRKIALKKKKKRCWLEVSFISLAIIIKIIVQVGHFLSEHLLECVNLNLDVDNFICGNKLPTLK